MKTSQTLIFRFGLPLSGALTPLLNRTNGALTSSGVHRTYIIYYPASYNPSTPTPLVLSFHGFSEWPAHQAQVSHWNTLADRHGFIVAYPCGTGIPLRWNTFWQKGRTPEFQQDVTFISDLIDKLQGQFNIDPRRIYANGLSNGGGMSFVLSAMLSERIAAFGSVAGAYTFPWSEYHPTRPVPAMIFHGTADPIVPFTGGFSGPSALPFPSIPEWVARLAEVNGCSPESEKLPAVGQVQGLCYAGSPGGADVVFYTVHGGGHSWPGGGSLPRFIAGETNHDIDATRLMWDFFQAHPLK